MHYYRRAHNRISPTTILYNKNGELFINAVSATSFVLSKEEMLNCELHQFAPEFLLSKGLSKSLKNDVWALGCVAILMMTATGLIRSPLHPYNSTSPSQEAGQMIDNLKQRHLSYFGETPTADRIYKNAKAKPGSLSEAAKSFISICLQPMSDDRPTIESLLEHEFFEGFDN